MPRAKQQPSTGVIIKDAHLQIDLRTYGYGRERLDLQPTPANIQHASRMRQEIIRKIDAGTFSLADYFPDSPRAQADSASTTWRQLGQEWLKLKTSEVQHSSALHYSQTLGSYHFEDWNDVRVLAIDFRKLKTKLGALPANAKTFNNIASVIRMVLEYGFKARLLREPLHAEIEMRRMTKPKPDPLTLAEADLVLGKIREGRGRNFYEFALFTGLRPSEQIALRWGNVDLNTGQVKVDMARTRFNDKGTKTGEERMVELNARALAALQRQRAFTQVAGAHVFTSEEGKAFNDTDGPLDAWWRPALRLAGVRHRDARQTRHTYATLCLHAGLTPAWAAKQLGHSVEMFYRVYSRWIEGADKGAETRKLDAFLSGKTGT